MRRFAVLLAVLLMGCFQTSVIPYLAAAPRPERSADEVQVLYARPSQPYEVLGVVELSSGLLMSDGRFEAKFRKEAAKLGGDAVVIVGSSIDAQGLVVNQIGNTYIATPMTISNNKVAVVVAWKKS
jgi:hypothetical protein